MFSPGLVTSVDFICTILEVSCVDVIFIILGDSFVDVISLICTILAKGRGGGGGGGSCVDVICTQLHF